MDDNDNGPSFTVAHISSEIPPDSVRSERGEGVGQIAGSTGQSSEGWSSLEHFLAPGDLG